MPKLKRRTAAGVEKARNAARGGERGREQQQNPDGRPDQGNQEATATPPFDLQATLATLTEAIVGLHETVRQVQNNNVAIRAQLARAQDSGAVGVEQMTATQHYVYMPPENQRCADDVALREKLGDAGNKDAGRVARRLATDITLPFVNTVPWTAHIPRVWPPTQRQAAERNQVVTYRQVGFPLTQGQAGTFQQQPSLYPEFGPLNSIQSLGKTGFRCEEIMGDLFECKTAEAMAHCVSQDFVMSAGIARQFKEKYGNVDFLKKQNPDVGDLAVLQVESTVIFYLVTKRRYFHKPTYDNLRSSLVALRSFCIHHGIGSIAMPKLGCGLDQLIWENVSVIIHEVFKNTQMKLQIFILPP